ncbi:MAG TPA: sulfatase [Thermoanaerobaculia bacterium]|nr:sulfatase [Thermoanaerobaculia bacterium]
MVVGCSDIGERDGAGSRQRLLDGAYLPDVLVESATVDWPPSLAGCRFLIGWAPGRTSDGRRVLLPAAGRPARLELVNLDGRTRELVIDFAERPAAGRVMVRAGGRDLGTVPLAAPLVLQLPMRDLAPGRVAVDLTFDVQPPGVLAAALRQSAAGEVKVDGADLLAGGDSLVDFVRPAEHGVKLVGSFVPPQPAGPDQRFELRVETERGAVIGRFAWSPSWVDRLRGSRPIELPLVNAVGFIRVRLRSSGRGAPGRWRGLAFASGAKATPRPRESDRRLAPPRLIVLYVMDALRADRVGYLGAPWGASPTLDRLAREGLAFHAHRSVAPNTLPSTKALFTGHPFVTRGGWKLMPVDGPTLAERFRAAGYHTGLFSGNVHVSAAFGTDRGFEHVAKEVLMDEAGTAEPTSNENAARVDAAALNWLRSLPAGAKAFLYLHTVHPHNPYTPPEPYRARFAPLQGSTIDGRTETLVGIHQGRITASEADRRRLAGLYTGSLAYNDSELAPFLAALAAWAPPSETLLAATSDHGEELFDHGGVLHGFTLYEEMLRIPLLLWSPGRIVPAAVETPTDTLDLHATLLDLAGIKLGNGVEGRSLARRVAPREVSLAAASSVKGGMYVARSDRFKLVWAPRVGQGWGMGEGLGRSRDPEYVFDLLADPGETNNLAGTDDFEVACLRSRLLGWIERSKDTGVDGEGTPVDADTRRRLRALGYVN